MNEELAGLCVGLKGNIWEGRSQELKINSDVTGLEELTAS